MPYDIDNPAPEGMHDSATMGEDSSDKDFVHDEYELPAEKPEPEPRQLQQWKSVFVIAINNDGVAFLSPDVDAFLADKEFAHPATPIEMWQGTSQVKKDLEAIEVAGRVLFNMQMLGNTLAQQAQNEAMAQAAATQDAGIVAMQRFNKKKQ